MTYEDRIISLRRRLRDLESAVVAFSGGVDSAVLAAVAHEELGDNMCAATAISPSIPSRDRRSAESLCRDLKIPHIFFETSEFDDPRYTSNPDDRCYYCKHALYEGVSKLASEKGFRHVVEGTNASDLSGHRPGHRASKQRENVVTPLVDAGMTKGDVRRLARELGLSVSEKPSSACLSSRIPSGVKLTKELLGKIDAAEELLRLLGVTQVRVRHNGDTARIEVMPAEFPIVLANREKIENKLQKLGYRFVTLDLSGYRTGGTAG